MSLNEKGRRDLICKFQQEHPQWKKSDIVQHFEKMKFSRRTVYSTLSRLENGGSTDRLPGSGRKSTLEDPKQKRRLKQQTAGKVAKTYRDLGRKFGCSHHTIKKHLSKLGIKRKSRKVKPKVTLDQENRQRARLRKLVHINFHAQNAATVAMDDETYFTLDGNEWQGSSYYELTGKEVDEKVKFLEKSKYPKKLMLWVTISEKGMSEPQFFESGLALNAERYQKLCLPKVARFLDQHHKDENVVFWPDLATSHYANSSLEEMVRLGIPYVPKDQNPPNTPQLRPVEPFWANLKRRVYANNYRSKSIENLKRKIKSELKKMPTSFFSLPTAEKLTVKGSIVFYIKCKVRTFKL